MPIKNYVKQCGGELSSGTDQEQVDSLLKQWGKDFKIGDKVKYLFVNNTMPDVCGVIESFAINWDPKGFCDYITIDVRLPDGRLWSAGLNAWEIIEYVAD